MKKLTRKQSGWAASICLFGGAASSMAAMFQGSLWFLALGLVLLVLGLVFLKEYLSGQGLS